MPTELVNGKMIEASSPPELSLDEETYYKKSLEEHADAKVIDYASNSRYSRKEIEREKVG